MSTLNITITEPGGPPEATTAWEIWETNAPADYDGFGTFTILTMQPSAAEHRQYCDIHLGKGAPCTCNAQPTRTVLIRCEHWNWQTARYSSGNNWHRASSLPVENVAEFLWNRLSGRDQ